MPSATMTPMPDVSLRPMPFVERRSLALYWRWALGCSVIAMVVGVLGLCGWLLSDPILAQLDKHSVLIAPRAAFAFVVLGIAVAVHLRRPDAWLGRALAIAAGAFVFWLATANEHEFPRLYTYLEPVLLKNVNIWEFIYRDRMEPLIAYTFFILAPCAVMLPFVQKLPGAVRDLVGGMNLLIVGVHSLLLLAFLYGTPLSYPVGYKPPSFPSAAASLAMGLAFLGAMGPRNFPLYLFAGPATRARLLRTFLPVGIISVIIYGLLTHTVFSPFNPALSSLLGIFLSTAIIAFLVLRTADVVSRQIERSVRESEQRFSILVEGIKDYALIMLDADGYVVTWNSGAERFTGYRGEEIIGEHFSCFYTPEDYGAKKPWEDLAAANARGSVEKHGWRLRKDGTRYWADVILTAVYDDAAGTLRGFAEITRDVTERRRAEEELQQKNDMILMLQKISAAANEAFKLEDVFQMTLELICRQMNWPIGHAFTFDPEAQELVPGIWELKDERYEPFKAATVNHRWKPGEGMPGRVLATGKPAWSGDLPQDMNTPRTATAMAAGIQAGYAFPIFLGNEVVAVLEFFSTRNEPPALDFLIVMSQVGYQLGQVMERQRIEEKMSLSIKEKELLLKEIHHRVKNNLQIITSLLRLQSESIHDPSVLDMFMESQSRVRSMALVHEYLYQSTDLASVRFADYVRNIVSGLARSYGMLADRLQIHFEIDETPLNLNTAIPAGLILTELVANVLKHAFPDGRTGNLWVRFYTAAPDTYKLIVKDDGCGLKADVQMDTTNSLGLRLVKTLVTQLHGTVAISRDNGTEFNLTLKKQN